MKKSYSLPVSYLTTSDTVDKVQNLIHLSSLIDCESVSMFGLTEGVENFRNILTLVFKIGCGNNHQEGSIATNQLLLGKITFDMCCPWKFNEEFNIELPEILNLRNTLFKTDEAGLFFLAKQIENNPVLKRELTTKWTEYERWRASNPAVKVAQTKQSVGNEPRLVKLMKDRTNVGLSGSKSLLGKRDVEAYENDDIEPVSLTPSGNSEKKLKTESSNFDDKELADIEATLSGKKSQDK